MTRTMRFYKRLLDISLLVSYFFMILLVALMVYSVSVGALNFEDTSTEPIISDNYAYLQPMYISVISGIVVFVIAARVFLQFITNTEKLETTESYKKQNAKGKNKNDIQENKKKQTELKLRGNELLFDSEKYVPKKERERHSAVPSVMVEEEKVQDKADEIIEPIEEQKPVGTLISDIVVEPVIDQKAEVTKAKKKQYYTRLNKAEMNKIIAKVLGISNYKAKKYVSGLLEIIKDELVLGNEVKIDDFGKFSTKLVKEHKGINPRTQESLVIPEHRTAKFTPYKKFKDDITNDVTATSGQYLFTRTAAKVLDEDRVANELEKERIARDHIEDTVTKPAATKKQKPVAIKTLKPKVPKKTKKDIIEYIGKETDLSKNKANKFLQGFADVVKSELSNKVDITIDKFGKFTTIHIPAKDAVNPATNEKIVVPEHNQVRLRFTDDFKSKFK